jgi:polysaccharide biosynthesis protein PslJ
MTGASGSLVGARSSADGFVRPRGWLGTPYQEAVAAGVMGAAIVGSMALDSAPLMALASAGVIGAAVVWPNAGLATLAFLAPLKPPPIVPAPGFLALLVAALLLGCILRLPIERRALRLGAPIIVLLGYVLYITVQQAPEMLAGYASKADHDVGFLYFQFLTAVGLLIAAGYLLDGRSPYPVLVLGLAGAMLTATIALATYDAPPAGPPFAGLIARPETAVRALGPFGNPNYMGTFAALAIALALGLMTVAKSRPWRGALVGIVVVVGVALGLSQSRGAIAAAFAGLAVVSLAKSRALAVAIVSAGIVTAFVLYPAFIQWRLENLGVSRIATLVESDNARIDGLLAGVQLFLSAPILGIGFGHYIQMSIDVPGVLNPINAHNWYLEVLAEQGLVGVLLWVALALAVVVRLRTRSRPARIVGFTMLATLAAASLFLEAPTSFQTFALPCLVLTAALVGDWSIPSWTSARSGRVP